jgi:hypothetical protein
MSGQDTPHSPFQTRKFTVMGAIGFGLPTFVEVLDNAPKCPNASDDSGKTHRNPSFNQTLVKLFHRYFLNGLLLIIRIIRDTNDRYQRQAKGIETAQQAVQGNGQVNAGLGGAGNIRIQ